MDLNVDAAQQRNVVRSQAHGSGLLEVPALFLKSIDEEKRQIRVLASSAALDRHGERILPEAFQNSITVFMANPVVLAAHSHRLDGGQSPVIGRVVRLWIDKLGLWAIIEFAESELAESYWQLYKGGFQRAVSVGFIPKRGEWVSEEGVRLYIHQEVELLEVSLVAVPSNPEALVKETGKPNSWLDAKTAEREDAKIMREILAENPDFDAECAEFAELILGGACDDGMELSDNDTGEGEDLNFAELVTAGAHLDQPVAEPPCACDWIADALSEDALGLSAGESFRTRGAGSARSPFYK